MRSALCRPMPAIRRLHDVCTDDGVRLALTEVVGPAGGPAFLLVAGFAQNRRAFLEGGLPAALVRRGARVFVGELRGHGQSREAAVPPRWTIHSHVRSDLPALTERVRALTRTETLHFVGHSMGGLIGLASLAYAPPFASMTTFATPLRIGSDRPVVRCAALVARAVNAVRPWNAVPMAAFLGALSGTLSAPNPNILARWFQRYAALASPAHADPAALKRILASADPESPDVFDALLAMAISGRPQLAGYDLEALGRAASIPWVAVHGSRDIFAPPSSVMLMSDGAHAGPRTVLEVTDATHVDLTVGHHVDRLVDRLWDLLFQVDTTEGSP